MVYYFGAKNGANKEIIETQTSSGTMVVNETIFQIINADLPFGGVGHSGYGRYHGESGFQAFSNMKSVLVKPPLNYWPFNLIFPPYDDATKDQILKSLSVGVYTQAQVGKFMFRLTVFIVLLVLAIVYRTEIGELIKGVT